MFSLYPITLIYFYGVAIHHKGDVSGAKFTASLMHSFFVLLLAVELLVLIDIFLIRSLSIMAEEVMLPFFLTFGVVLNLFNMMFFFGSDDRLKKYAEKRGVDLVEVSWRPGSILYFGAIICFLLFGFLVASIR